MPKRDLNLYLIDRGKFGGWDTYRSAVVIATSANAASYIHPGTGAIYPQDDDNSWGPNSNYSWVASPEEVSVTYLGPYEGPSNPKTPVVCSNFNAG